MVKAWPSKDPDEVLRYTYDWSPDLAEGETLTDTILVDPLVPAGTTVEAVQHDDAHVFVIISGGTTGEEAQFLIRPTTSTGEVLEDTVVLPIFAKVKPVAYPGGYIDPTPGNLVALYPEFADVPVTTLETYMAEAARIVDTSWTEGDFGRARMALAAHNLTINGIGETPEARAIRGGSEEFRVMGIGPLRLERFDRPGGTSEFAKTRYGKAFRQMLRMNKGGARVTGLRVASGADGDRAQSPTYWGG